MKIGILQKGLSSREMICGSHDHDQGYDESSQQSQSPQTVFFVRNQLDTDQTIGAR